MHKSLCRAYLHAAEYTHFHGRLIAIAGALLVIAGCVGPMGIIPAKSFYPGYGTAGNALSDLDFSRPPSNTVHQPSAAIFNLAMLATDPLGFGADAALHQAGFVWPAMVPLGLFGLDASLVGVFSESPKSVRAPAALFTSSPAASRRSGPSPWSAARFASSRPCLARSRS